MKIKWFSEQANRETNEDYVLSKKIDKNTSLHIVADGMGGYTHGAMASELVANIIFDFAERNSHRQDYEFIIEEAIHRANKRVLEQNVNQNTNMGTTIAGILMVKHIAYMFWVGDVKILQFRNEKLIFESKDHSLINKLKDNNSTTENIDYGNISHIVTRSIDGKTDKYLPDFHIAELVDNDRLIICSDGVLERASYEDISKLKVDYMDVFSSEYATNRDNASLILIDV